MSEMLDRVAAAIYNCKHISGRGVPNVNGAMELARAAVTAMREPTGEMYKALCATNKMWKELTSRDVWQTYIDSILAKEPKPLIDLLFTTKYGQSGPSPVFLRQDLQFELDRCGLKLVEKDK